MREDRQLQQQHSVINECSPMKTKEEKKKRRKEAKLSRKKRLIGSKGVTSTANKRIDPYKRVDPGKPWTPPRSRYNLIQEEYCYDQWRVLIVCILLNRTNGYKVRDVLEGLFRLCPDAETTTRVSNKDIELVIRTLGFQKRRAKVIKKFSREYLGKWTEVTELHGVGKYAADAYAMFCAGKAEQVIPQDHMLVHYWKYICHSKDSAPS